MPRNLGLHTTRYDLRLFLRQRRIDVLAAQTWNSSQWELNDGPQGLQRLDKVIETAGKYGIKVILAFTNNWYALIALRLVCIDQCW